jgi:hypothetical protein
MCIEGYESILATFNRDQLRFGDATVVDLEGETADGYTLKVTIGEKAIVVRFTQPRPAENSAEAGEIISRMKELITQTSPHVRFDDHWVEPKEK